MDLIFFVGWDILLARTFFQKRKDLQNGVILEVFPPSECLELLTVVNFWSHPAQKRPFHMTLLQGKFHDAIGPRCGAFSGSSFSSVERRVFLFHACVQQMFSLLEELHPCTHRGIPHGRLSDESPLLIVHTLYHRSLPTARKRCMDPFPHPSDLPAGACIPRQRGMPAFTSHSKQNQRRMEGL